MAFSLCVALALALAAAGCGGGGGKGGDYVPKPAAGISARTLTGTVTTATGAPLSGVSVSISNTALTATSDASGAFQISDPPAGMQMAAFSAAGYLTQNVPVYIPEGQRAISVQLQSSAGLSGAVTMSSSPAGAAIALDGADTGSVTDTTISGLSPGAHSITLALAGAQPVTFIVNVPSGQTVTLPRHSFFATPDADTQAVLDAIEELTAAFLAENKNAYLALVSDWYSSATNADKAALDATLTNTFSSYDIPELVMDVSSVSFFNDGFADYAEVYAYQDYTLPMANPNFPSGYGAVSARELVYQVWIRDAGGWLLIWEQLGDGVYITTSDRMPIGTTQQVYISAYTTLGDGSVSQTPAAAAVTDDRGQSFALTLTNGRYYGSFVGGPTAGQARLSVQVSDQNGVSYHTNIPIAYTDLEAAPTVQSVFGTRGVRDGEFTNPVGIHLDSADRLFVVDGDNDRVQVFDANNAFLYKFGLPGAGQAFFRYPTFLKIDSLDRVYISDLDADQIKVFDTSGNFLRAIGGPGVNHGQLNAPMGIHIDDVAGRLYICDSANDRIEVFDLSGNYLTTYSDPSIITPYDVTVRNGRIYVAGYAAESVQILDAATGAWAGAVGSSFRRSALDGFQGVLDVETDANGNVYIFDWDQDGGESYIKVFDSAGKLLTLFGGTGAAPGLFSNTSFLHVSADGIIYATDPSASRVQVFR
jgi:DNA-binding beta-propeller fold protein YncE